MPLLQNFNGTPDAPGVVPTGSISLAEMADMATASLIGRNTAGTGVPEVLSASTARALLGLKEVTLATGTGAAVANTAALQAALTAKGMFFTSVPGTYYVNATLLLYSNTYWRAVPGVEIRASTGLNASVLQNANRSSSVDTTNIIDGVTFNGDKANQSTAFSTVDMKYLTHTNFYNCKFNGGLRTGTFGVDASSDGEGLVLRNSQFCNVICSHAEDNSYDGFKTRFSKDIKFTAISGKNNGRCVLQIAGTNTLEDTEYSERVTAVGVTQIHDTGTPSASSPVTSDVYFHGARNCSAIGVDGYGSRQAVGFANGSFDNYYYGVSRNRGVTGKASVGFESSSSSAEQQASRNSVDIGLRPISGASLDHVNFNGAAAAFNTVNFRYASAGDGTGTWTITVQASSNGNIISGFANGATLSDSGTNTDLSKLKTDAGPLNATSYILSAGTAYNITATPAAVTQGTTNPVITVPAPGKWLIITRVRTKYEGATFAASRTLTLKLRRTNNTAADLTDGSVTSNTDIVTTKTASFEDATWTTEYTTANSDDSLTVFASLDVIPTAGNLTVNSAKIHLLRVGAA